MAEPRRVQLACLSSATSQHLTPAKRLKTEDQVSEPPAAATVRIALTLFEPNQKRCPEFCYPELLRNSKKGLHREKSHKKIVNLFNVGGEERKEVSEAAKQFEIKYDSKKRRRDRMQDLIDMGYGYDESDSFIDNSEAYDELVPASLNTRYGGFYINSGTLQFRQASESEDEAFKEKKKKLSKKVKEKEEKTKKKKRAEEKKSKKNKHPKLGFAALNGTKEKKKKKKHSVNYKEMLERFQQEKEAQKTIPKPVSSSLAPKPPVNTQPPTLPPLVPKEALPATGPPMSDVELLKAVSAIDSMSEKEMEDLLKRQLVNPTTTATEKPIKIVEPLPEGLSPPLEKKIKDLTKAVRASEGDKKLILFTQEMNSALLDIYLLSRDLSSSIRSLLFMHLGSILPCGKDTLGSHFREPLRKLKEAVSRAMPEQISKYHEECKVHNEAKYSKLLEDDKEKDQKAVSEEDEEEEKSGRKSAGPRKKFQWNDEIRQLLCQLLRTKVDLYEPQESAMQSMEDYLKSFLDGEVKTLWPRGWMQARTKSYCQKLKVKEKQEKKSGPPQKERVVSTSISSKEAVTTSTPSPALRVYTQDNSLDGDLIHNLPTLDTVSEHLNGLSSHSSGVCFDFSNPRMSPAEKNTVLEEKRRPGPQPLLTLPNSSQVPRIVSANQPLIPGSEKKVSVIHTAKPSPEVQQVKQRPQCNGSVKHLQTTRLALQPSVKLYQMSCPQSKVGFMHQSGNLKGTVQSSPQRVTSPQTKLKPQGGHSSSPNIFTRPAMPSNCVSKNSGNTSSAGQQVQRPPLPRNPNPSSSSSGSSSIQNPSPTVSLSSSSSNPSRHSIAPPTKQPTRPPQKLTLVAPQNSGGGNQGVAKLLTSSMVTGTGISAPLSSNISQPSKCTAASSIFTTTAALTVLTPPYKANMGKLPGPASLGLLSPIHTFPLHVISFSSDSPVKPAASKDAVVTGPAPGTFHHGLPRSKHEY
ncbi:hypothetical protein GDO86_017615 [Hymenochirus boettgeri]|uniref:Ubinuclein 1 n=1 Tax=Hymenochirus boettgeri TaxID=247094 RepID=A0A8T2IQP9_9PIPI|nr:hypothetical protein GDO86_017615 [Hymenochirus boettgeri]